MTRCSKPNCSKIGAAVLGYNYARRLAVLEDAGTMDPSPHVYVLCGECADALRPPRGWDLDDRRTAPMLFVEQSAETRFVTHVEVPSPPHSAPAARRCSSGILR